MTVANLLTLCRLALVPAIGWAILEHHALALWLFGVSMGTDLLDGIAARTFSQSTNLGALLDPLADKCTLVVSFSTGAYIGVFPLWFVALMVSRDALLLATVGFCLARQGMALKRAQEFEPTALGKYAASAQFFTVLGVLLMQRGIAPEFLATWMPAWLLFCALLTLASGVRYLVRFLKQGGFRTT